MKDLFAPRAGAIVWAWMPESEHVIVPGPKFRPVLILDAARREDSTLEVLVAYGTTQKTDRFGRGELILRKAEAPFLKDDTKFLLAKRMWLPVTRGFFAMNGVVTTLNDLPASVVPVLYRAAVEVGLA